MPCPSSETRPRAGCNAHALGPWGICIWLPYGEFSAGSRGGPGQGACALLPLLLDSLWEGNMQFRPACGLGQRRVGRCVP